MNAPTDPWTRVEIETDALGDTITHCTDDTGEHVILETMDSNDQEGIGMPDFTGWMPRLSAIEIVGGDVWTFRLNDRATVLELSVLGHYFEARMEGEDENGRIIMRPGKGIAKPTREQLVTILTQSVTRAARS